MSIFLSARTLILQALVRGEAYGLEVADRVEKLTRGATKVGPGRLYPELRALEAEGLVTSREGDPSPERGGRPRVYYKITALGARAAMEQREITQSVFDLVPAGGKAR